jgi:hypothetical protein
MAHAVERASADIADRVVIRALAKLQLQQNVRELLPQENCVQTDGIVSDVYRKGKHYYRYTFDKNYVAIRKAREEGAEKMKRIHDVDNQKEKPEKYSLAYVAWWVREEVQNKIKNIRDTRNALHEIMDKKFIEERERERIKTMRMRGGIWNAKKYDEEEELEREKKAETDKNYNIWFISDGWYKVRFVGRNANDSEIINELTLQDFEDRGQFSLETRRNAGMRKLAQIKNTNNLKEDAIEKWLDALAKIELLQQHIIGQWQRWYVLFKMVQTASDKNPTDKELRLQATKIKGLLDKNFVDEKVDEEYLFPKEVTRDRPDEKRTKFVKAYCKILINYIPLCYAMGYLDMEKVDITNPKGRFCVLYSTKEIETTPIAKLSEHFGGAT